ncbi:hypothetical protein RHMOL_Rhmol10G0119700 [Rhododendron molle]|uniref:Uncharacterized protein n=1 Tax=Rhododendron molle TaxID=49168 RepID=A0ACC0M2E9_RHOML|nr:hypothetical protein RHMOL_Rhmol10G0119700 [Rhododendron molle]
MRPCAGSSLHFMKREILTTPQGARIQATVFGSNIHVFENTLKLFHTYSITNANINTTPEEFRFLEQRCQLIINSRTPVEGFKVDNLTMRSIKFNFTPIAMLSKINVPNFTLDVIFAVLEVGECKPANNSFVADVRIVDQSLQPTIISMWEHFSEYEAPAMASLKGMYPVAIGLRLKTSTYCGTTFATQKTSEFILDPQTPEAITLQSWCIANANKIKQLPSMIAMKPLMLATATSSSNDPVKIINLPTSVEKESLPTELLNRLSEAKNNNITLRAYMYTCAGISQLKFTVHSMSIQSTSDKFINAAEVLALPPPTPAKKEKAHAPSTSEDLAKTNPAKKQKLNTNEQS